VYNLEAYLPSFLRDFLHTKLVSLRIWLIENGMLADNPSGHGESRLVAAAREAYENLRNDVSSKETTLTNEENDLSKDYGPDDIFRALQGKCATIEAGEYEYELCWLDKTTQKSKSGHGSTNMGNYASMDTQIADEEERIDGKSLGKGPRTVLRYEDGQGCWNGPNRKTDVWLACAETDEIWRVAEAEKCVYKMEVGTPAACEDVGEPVIGVKDEL
jgi:protein kinase C substrate 80K-H